MNDAEKPYTLGVFFGSFDPIHNGHLAVVLEALSTQACYEVLLVVQPYNAYKTAPPRSSLVHRTEMARRATETMASASVANLDSGIPPEHSIESTLRLLKEQDRDRELVLLLGQDLADSIATWPDYDKIKSLSSVFVAKRTASDVSSKQIRELIINHQSIKDFVPQVVADYINTHSLYLKKH